MEVLEGLFYVVGALAGCCYIADFLAEIVCEWKGY